MFTILFKKICVSKPVCLPGPLIIVSLAVWIISLSLFDDFRCKPTQT